MGMWRVEGWLDEIRYEECWCMIYFGLLISNITLDVYYETGIIFTTGTTITGTHRLIALKCPKNPLSFTMW